MNVASLELCRELYELSGWMPEDIPVADEEGHVQEISFPAYDLGYLLRKLPRELEYQGELIIDAIPDANDWLAAYGYLGDGTGDFTIKADTPEDAAAKLAIQLFKQGILQREAAS